MREKARLDSGADQLRASRVWGDVLATAGPQRYLFESLNRRFFHVYGFT
jgi:hypothetical protein